jgi:hypothetical protein
VPSYSTRRDILPHLPKARKRVPPLALVHAVLPRADERETNQDNYGFDRNEDGIKAVFMVRDVDSVYQRDQKGEKKANAKGKAKHHENSANAPGERSEEPPPIQMRMKIKHPHGAAELRPTMFAREKNRSANQNEDKPDARAQEEETGFPIFSKKL